MKLLQLALYCVVLSQHVISQESLDITDQISDISDCLRNILQKGLPDFGVPILDPLNIPQLSINLSSFGIPFVSGTLNLSNLLVEGISKFVLEDVSISINDNGLTIKFKLIEPSINLNSDYNLKALILVLPVNANGKLSIGVIDLVASVDITALLQVDNIQVANLKINPTIGNLNLDFGGSLAIWISNLIQNYINENSNELGVLIGDYLRQAITNAKGTEYDINNIINFIFTNCIVL